MQSKAFPMINTKATLLLLSLSLGFGNLACQKNLIEPFQAQSMNSDLQQSGSGAEVDPSNPGDPAKTPPAPGAPAPGAPAPGAGGGNGYEDSVELPRQTPLLCYQDASDARQVLISKVTMNLDHAVVVYEDGAIVSVPPPVGGGGMGSIDLLDLSRDVLKVLNIDKSLVSGGSRVREIWVYFRNDNNYVYNFVGNPICRWSPERTGTPSLVIEVGAKPYDINKSVVSFPIESCDIVMMADGDCSLKKSVKGSLSERVPKPKPVDL